MMKILLFFLLFFLFQKEVSTKKLTIGESHCIMRITEKKSAVATLVSLHENEQVAVQAYNSLSGQISFNLIELKQNNKREITFKQNGKGVLIDPNRVFTNIGIVGTLNKYQLNNYSAAHKNTVVKFSNELISYLTQYKTGDYIIAIHNNSDGRKGKGTVSILNYQDEKNEQNGDIKDCYVNPAEDEDDFVLVTNQNDFNYVKNKKVNVALYKDKINNDDGSLSVYCIQNNIPYINIEAQQSEKGNHLKGQKKLLEYTYELLTNKNKKL